MYRFVLMLGLIFGFLYPAQAWWNEEWTYRKVITIDTTATGLEITEPIGEVSVLVRLHTGNFGYFFDIAQGGADLRFLASDDATPLKHHVEKLDPINNMALFWVKVPAVNLATSDKIYMYYGNATAANSADVGGTFDQAEALVLHFDEPGTPQDKSFGRNNPTAFNAEVSKASLIGQGVKFDGSGSMSFATSPSLDISADTGWTFSAWVKPDAEATDAVLFEYGNGANTLSLKQQGSSLISEITIAGQSVQSTPSQPLLIGDWQHVAVVINGGEMLLYINGQAPISTAIPAAAISGNLVIGGLVGEPDSGSEDVEDDAATAGPGFVGEMDEVRIASVARSASWLAIATDNQGKLARMLAYGGDESQETEGSAEEGGHGGYFGIIIDNVFGNDEAIVEQIVIGFCGFMAIVAFLIMFFKTYTVFGAKAASKKFLKAYDGLGSDKRNFAKLYNAEKKYGKSPLFQVYKTGITELKKRISSGGDNFTGLEPKSVNAIRSSLDATMVRQGQKINSLIVLLTIAISGGPFIGLLGTVVGVMVTFAGIAASGEVNINAIAPGMAAALLATVAGLGVAIPSLFGYNYIGSHIKELQADMHVFAEEFMGRLNESFGR